jgi:hypothetical protein
VVGKSRGKDRRSLHVDRHAPRAPQLFLKAIIVFPDTTVASRCTRAEWDRREYSENWCALTCRQCEEEGDYLPFLTKALISATSKAKTSTALKARTVPCPLQSLVATACAPSDKVTL